jgi:nucleotidyltransferase/DNA polymerase involved in DNA repair
MQQKLFYEKTLKIVGRSNKKKFIKFNINTIGDLANSNPDFLKKHLGVRGSNYVQLSLGDNFKEIERHEKIDNTIDKLRYRFEHYAIQRGITLVDEELSRINPKEDHVIHPIGYR